MLTTQTYHYGDVVTLTESPKNGYTFLNWGGDASGTANNSSITVTKNMVVTATFIQTYSLTVNTVGSGSVTKNPDQISYLSGSIVQLSASPVVGWSFSGWSGGVTGLTNPVSLTMDAAKTVTATFTQNSYSLTVNTVGSGSVSKNPNSASYLSGSSVQLSASPVAGWSFSGWSGAITGSTNPASLTMDSNKTVTATFIQNNYTVSYTVLPSSGGTVTRTGTGSYHYGDTVVLTESPSNGYTFSSWSGDGTGTGTTRTVTVTGNMVVTATFTQNTYTVGVTVSPSSSAGSVTGYVTTQTYHYGDLVTLTETANNGYTFSSWGVDGSGTATTCAITVTKNMVVTATFIQNHYSVVFAVSGGGVSTTSPSGTQSYTLGQVVPVSVTAAPGYSFSVWSATGGITFDSAASASTNAHIGGAGTVIATFTQNSYSLTVNTVGSGSVIKNPNSASYLSGSIVQLSASPVVGWSFSGWSGAITGLTNPVSLTMNSAKTVTATFTLNPTSSPSPTSSPTPTPTISPTPTPTSSLSPTPTIAPTPTDQPTPNPTTSTTINPTSAPTQITSTPKPSSTPQITPTPSPNSITILVTAVDGSNCTLIAQGAITSSNVNGVTISTDGSKTTTTLSLMVVDQSVTNGFGNITIPKSAILHNGTPNTYINNLIASNQGYSQDAKNYYVWYNTNSKTYELSIVFKEISSSSNGFPLWIFLGLIPIIVLVTVVVFARKKILRPHVEKGDDYSDYI